MKLGLGCLVLGYLLSQFYRAFLAVLAGPLARDLGVSPDDLALSSGLWFLVFASAQIPLGMALDRFGPRRTTSLMLGLGGTGGALVFASATSALHVHAAMILLGIGCAPVLMASYYIFARTYPPALFATLAGAVIGIGSLGNILGAWPLAWAADAFGWRIAMIWMAVLTGLVALVLWRVIPDPPRAHAPEGNAARLRDLLRIPALWWMMPLLVVNYAPAAGLRGLWAGPYLTDVYQVSATAVGQATLVMAFAMIAGNLAYGPMDRWLGTRKWVILGGNLCCAVALGFLALWPDLGVWASTGLLAAVGFFGASFPLLMAHGRSFIPPHLTGRGMTFINLFSIGGVGLLQVLSGQVHALGSGSATAPYTLLFGFFAVLMLIGCAVYLFAADRTD